jgi:hypothetical protein
VLLIGHGEGATALAELAGATGGSVVEELDATKWAQAARELLRSAMPDRLSREKVDVVYAGALSSLSRAGVSPWNRVWLKEGATVLASGAGNPMAAQWQMGEGRVAGMAYRADVNDVERLAERVAVKPRDPRFTVNWTEGARLHISVDAMDGGKFMNEERMEAEISGPVLEKRRVEQTGPGRYEAEMEAPREAEVVSIRDGEKVLERFAVAGRYAREFDAIGNDRKTLGELAKRTGGAVIEVGDAGPIDFRWPVREIFLSPWLASLGAVLIGAGLVGWRRGSGDANS